MKRAEKVSRIRQINWIVAGFIGATGVLGALSVSAGTPIWWFRCALLLGAGFVVWRGIKEEKQLLFFSPVFLIAVLALVPYSLLPALYVEVYEWIFLPVFPEGHGLAHQQAAAYVGSSAERLILLFAALAFASAVALLPFVDARSAPKFSDREPPPAWLWPLVLLSLALSGARAAVSVLGISAQDGFLSRLEQDALDAALPYFAFTAACQGYYHSGSCIRRLATVGTIVLGAALLILAYSTKGALIASLAAGALGLLGHSLRVRKVVLTAVAGGILVALVLGGHNIIRQRLVGTDLAAASPTQLAMNAVTYKVILRQATTGYCFREVIARYLDFKGEGNPFYFFAGIVPRYFWAEKPSLSRGAEYAVAYCGTGETLPERPHSASITLLGEPIREAGREGLVVATIIILTGLTAISLVGMSVVPGGLVMMVSLLPWLVDFDQHFALYIANALKAALYLSPVIGLLIILQIRRRERA